MSEKMLTNRITKLKALETEKKDLEKQIKVLQDKIKRELASRGAEEMKAGDYTIRFTSFIKNGFDTKAFAISHPRLYKRFLREQESRRFSIA